jgi:hypothetical protein
MWPCRKARAPELSHTRHINGGRLSALSWLQGAGDAGFGFAGTEDTAGAPLFAHFAKGDGLRGAEAPLFHEALSG